MKNKLQLSSIYILLSLVLLCIFTSCGGSKALLYNPAEVAYLSEKLRIPINNDDPNITLFAEASLWLGTPYRYGGNTKRGADCSGFVNQIYNRVYRKQLERSSDDQAKKNVHEIRKSNLKTGDLVFFKTLRNSKKIDHVGIFLRNDKFIHASTSKGVIISSLNEEYYLKNWKKAGRVK